MMDPGSKTHDLSSSVGHWIKKEKGGLLEKEKKIGRSPEEIPSGIGETATDLVFKFPTVRFFVFCVFEFFFEFFVK